MKPKTVVIALVGILSLLPTQAFPQAVNQPQTATPLTTQDTPPEAEESYSDGSILTGLFEGTRNKLGFSFSANSTYTPDRVLTTSGQGASLFSNFNARMFANFRQRRGALSLNYAFGYRTTNGARQSSPVHSGQIRYTYNLGRTTTLHASDTITSTQNDYGYGVPNAFIYQGQGLPVYQVEIFLDRQRVTRNIANVSVDFQPSRNTELHLSGSHTSLWFEKTTGEVQGFQAGIDGSYKLNEWLTLGTGYTAYFNPGSVSQRDSLIHRAQLASFGFDLAWGIRLQSSGGIEYTHEGGNGLATTGVQLGWKRSGRNNALSVDYHRGFSKALGPGVVLEGNDARINFEQRITDRIHFNAGTQAIDGSSRFGASLRNISAGAGFEFLLAERLVANLNGGYAYQDVSGLLPTATNLSRYTVTAGVTYVIPAMGR